MKTNPFLGLMAFFAMTGMTNAAVESDVDQSVISKPTFINDEKVTLTDSVGIRDSFDSIAYRVVQNENLLLTYSPRSPKVTFFHKSDHTDWLTQEYDFQEKFGELLGTDNISSLSAVAVDEARLLIRVVYDTGNWSGDSKILSVFTTGSNDLTINILEDTGIENFQLERMKFADNLMFYNEGRRFRFFSFDENYKFVEQSTLWIDDMLSPSSWSVDQLNNKLIVGGESNRWTDRNVVLSQYSYSNSSTGFSVSLDRAVTVSEDYDWQEIKVLEDDNQDVLYLFYPEQSELKHLQFEPALQQYVEVKTTDLSAFEAWPYRIDRASPKVHKGNLINLVSGFVYGLDISGNDAQLAFEYSLRGELFTGDVLGIVASNEPTRILNSSNQFSAITERKTIPYARKEYVVSLKEPGKFLSVLGQQFTLFEMTDDAVVVLNTYDVDTQLSGTLRTYKDKFVHLNFNQVTFSQLVSNEDSTYSVDVRVKPLLDKDGNNIYIYSSKVAYDEELGVLVYYDNNSLHLFDELENNFVRVFTVSDGVSDIDGLDNVSHLALHDGLLYVLSLGDQSLTVFDPKNNRLELIAQVFDETAIRSVNSMSVTDKHIVLQSGNYVTTFRRDSLSLLSMTLINTSTYTYWQQNNSHYALKLDRLFNDDVVLDFMQMDNVTGQWYEFSSVENLVHNDETVFELNGVLFAHKAHSDSSPATLKLRKIQYAPVALTNKIDFFFNQGKPSSLVVSDLFDELDEADTLIFSSEDNLESFGLGLESGELSVIDSEFYGSGEVTIMATDETGKFASVIVNVEANRRPQLAIKFNDISIQTNETFSLDLNNAFFDDQDQTITITLAEDVPEEVSLNDNVLSGRFQSAGSYSVTIHATDNLGAVNTQSISVVVSSPPPPPTVTSPPERESSSGGSVNLGVILFLLMISISRLRRRQFS